MIADRMRIPTDSFLGEMFTFTVSATRALTTMIRNVRRSKWFPLLAIAGGAAVAVIAIKLMALFAAAFEISFLRDVGNNVGSGGAAGGAGGGLGGLLLTLLGEDPNQYYYPGYPPPYQNPYGYGPLGNPVLGGDGNPLTDRGGAPFVIGPHGPISASNLIGPDGQYAYPGVSAGVMIYFSEGVQAAATAIIGRDGKDSSGNAGGKA